MSFRKYTGRVAVVLRLILSLAYLFVGGAGVAALWLTPTTISSVTGIGITYFWGALAVLGGFAGFAAVIYDRWRLEFIAAPLAAGGVLCYAISVWSLVLEATTRSTQANMIVATGLLLLYRTVELFATAEFHRNLKSPNA